MSGFGRRAKALRSLAQAPIFETKMAIVNKSHR